MSTLSGETRNSKKVSFVVSSEGKTNYDLAFHQELFTVCRIVYAFTILADAVWYYASFEVRSAYFKDLGIPVGLLYVIITVYTYFGVRLLLNLGLESTCLGMVVTYAIIGFIIHHPVGSGGIGDYPKHLHGEINFKQMLSYQALIGGLLVMMGYPDMVKNGKIMQGTKSYAMILGRAVIAIHFLLQTLYFKVYHYERLSKHLLFLEKNRLLHILIIGFIHVFGSYFVWLGRTGFRRKRAALMLSLTTIGLALVEKGDPASGVLYQMKPEAKIHYFIVQTGIVTSCLLLYAIGSLEAQPYKHAAD